MEILLTRMKYTHEIVGTDRVPLEHAPGTKTRVCIGLYSDWEPSRASGPCALGTCAFKFQHICGSAEELVVHIFVSLV